MERNKVPFPPMKVEVTTRDGKVVELDCVSFSQNSGVLYVHDKDGPLFMAAPSSGWTIHVVLE